MRKIKIDSFGYTAKKAEHIKRRRKVLFAVQVQQDLMLFRLGYEYISSAAFRQFTGTVNRVEWDKLFRDWALRDRGNSKDSYPNAERAMHIMRHGEQSKWWFARASNNSAGTNKRGIVHYLQQFERKRNSKAARAKTKDIAKAKKRLRTAEATLRQAQTDLDCAGREVLFQSK